MNDLQLDGAGRLRHLVTLDGLPIAVLNDLLDTAEAFRASAERGVKAFPLLRGHTVVNLFFEPSTRTRTSFELAAKRLSADVINFDAGSSSTRKGETVLDTLRTIQAMGCDLFVVRHQQPGTPAHLATNVDPGVAVMNAGDGNHAHPTQGLLDAFTIRRHKPNFNVLKVAIIGDILHSRVARSDIHALLMLGVGELRLCAPAMLLPDTVPDGCHVFEHADSAVNGADVVIALRLQTERMVSGMVPSEIEYFRDYGISRERMARAKSDAIVMHPGPMNRGVEIASEVADGPQSVILEQVANGVHVRMAVMARLMGGAPSR